MLAWANVLDMKWHKAQAGLEAVAPKKLLPVDLIAEGRKELFEIREGIFNLMDEFRGH